jgi:hypothetical protein
MVKMSKPRDFIDRKAEIALFEAMVADQALERVLALLIGPEKGKSYLMNYLWGHCQEQEIIAALVDFDARQKGPVSYWKFVNEVVDQVGRSNFPTVKKIKALYGAKAPLVQTGEGSGGVDFGKGSSLREAEVTGLAGRDYVHIGNVTLSESEWAEAMRQEQLMEEMGRAFRTDLAELGTEASVVLLLDTYEQAARETRKWLDEWLFRWLPKHQANLYLVVAGRPELHDYFRQPSVWQALVRIREDLSAPQDADVQKYTEIWGFEISGDEMRPFILAAQQNMALLAQLRDLYRMA